MARKLARPPVPIQAATSRPIIDHDSYPLTPVLRRAGYKVPDAVLEREGYRLQLVIEKGGKNVKEKEERLDKREGGNSGSLANTS